MESLDSLPTDEAQSAPKELQIIQKYFDTTDTSSRSYQRVKFVGFATLIFLLVSNPIFDKILEILPNMNSSLIRFGVKTILFFVLVYFIFTALEK